jgi:Fe-S cluster biogenesis protein NfuA
MDAETKIIKIIEHIRPYILADGGDLEYISYKDGIVTIALSGACIGCSLIGTTLNDGIKSWIMSEVPEVQDVVLQEGTVELEGYDFY